MAGVDDIVAVVIGTPGPPGTGVTSAEKATFAVWTGGTFTGVLTQTIGGADPTAIPNQISPFTVKLATAGSYADSGSGNLFHLSSYVRNTGSRPTVAVFGEGVGDGAASAVWGGNFVAYANHAGATAMGVEINYGSLVSGGAAFGLVIAAAGNYATTAAIQIQSNTDQAAPPHALVFNGSNHPVATSSFISVLGVPTLPIGIDLNGPIYTTAPINFPSNATSTSASSGSASTLPGTPQGYLVLSIAGAAVKVPYYNT